MSHPRPALPGLCLINHSELASNFDILYEYPGGAGRFERSQNGSEALIFLRIRGGDPALIAALRKVG